MPRFLAVDQPSQVYFPEAWPSMDQAPEVPGKSDRSPDIDGVRRIFGALAAFFETVGARFQAIVTEHAGAITRAGVLHILSVTGAKDMMSSLSQLVGEPPRLRLRINANGAVLRGRWVANP